WVSLRSTHPTKKQWVVGWVERSETHRRAGQEGPERLPAVMHETERIKTLCQSAAINRPVVVATFVSQAA
ncbi:MAG: hypothetical protein RKP73_00715, partial [Candidatus Contendobacter sp.]|nr:hypothetical protein [Candidatus Contendobacter sp.]